MFEHPNEPFSKRYQNQAGVYRLNIGPHFYIGSSSQLGARRCQHLRRLRSGEHKSPALQAAWGAYGSAEFVVLTLVPPREIDEPGDHAARLLLQEHLAIQSEAGDELCCNQRDLASFSPGLVPEGDEPWKRNKVLYSAQRRWEARAQGREVRHRPALGSSTRAKMSESKKGGRHPRARKCFLSWPDGREEEFSCAADAARAVGVSPQIFNMWMTGSVAWPGVSPRARKKTAHLAGLRGWYAPSEVPRRVRNSALDRSKKLVEVELVRGGVAERFATIHAAAKWARVSHLTLYLWLLGERPWPDGLSGRAVTPL